MSAPQILPEPSAAAPLLQDGRRPTRISILIAILSLMAGGVCAALLARATAGQAATVVIEAFVSSGSRFALYYNNNTANPLFLPVAANQWHSYEFKVVPKLTSLRFDPSDENGSTAQIRKVTFHSGLGGSRPLDLAALQSWVKYHADVAYDAHTGVVSINATGPDEFLMGPVNVNLPTGSLPFQIRPDAASLLWGCVVAGAIYFLLQTGRIDRSAALVYAVIAPLAIAASRLALYFVPLLHLQPSAPDDAIGASIYGGVSKSADQATVLTAVLFTALTIFAGAFLEKWLRRRAWSLDTSPIDPRRADYKFVLSVIAVFAALSFPDLKMICASASAVRHAFDFDSQIRTVWQYLAHQGFLPYRDFWYPYAGLYNKTAQLLPELLLDYVYRLVTFSVVAASSYVLFGFRKFPGVFFFFFVFPMLDAAGALSAAGAWRYFLSFSILLAFGAALSAPRPVFFWICGVWSVYVLTQESSQLVYAAPAVLFLGLAALVLERNAAARRRLLRMMGQGAAAFGAALTCWLLFMLARHQLFEWWLFVSTFTEQSHYMAVPFPVMVWFDAPMSVDPFGFLALLLLFSGSILHIFRQRRLKIMHVVPLASALLTLMILQKEVLRPGIAAQFMVIPLFGLAIALIQGSNGEESVPNRPWPDRLLLAWTCFASAFLFAYFAFLPGAARPFFEKYYGRLPRLPANLSYAVTHKAAWDQAANDYFSAASVMMGDQPGNVARDQFLAKLGGSSGQIFALGDCAYWYLLLHQPAPFYFMFFNQAPLRAQENTLHWLETNRPAYVLWDPGQTQVDGIPNQVRVPLLFGYVASNYVLHTQVGRFLVLRRRAANENPDLAFWAARLGPVNLGYLPALSHLRDSVSKGPGIHVSYAMIQVADPMSGREEEVRMTIGETPLTVHFVEDANVRVYTLRLDRLALAAAGSVMGQKPVIVSIGPDPAAAVIRQDFLRYDLLY